MASHGNGRQQSGSSTARLLPNQYLSTTYTPEYRSSSGSSSRSTSQPPSSTRSTSSRTVPREKSPYNDRRGSNTSTSSPTQTQTETVSRLEPPIAQFAINVLLQLAAFAAAIAFGVFAVKSVQVGNRANAYANAAAGLADKAMAQAEMANQLTLLALCTSENSIVSTNSY
ncbi:hypothetical protein BU24DRAFT_140696 [Aaosphaeria arxii CBS 175.79]|uniref:Uncharacterized protein n=1 Tax=Aaosphaeria arxii CBS 175.79 TaxID=1450172 RepID=A0A6A5XWB0_9PLEO|nr:uncharacterized protein BU24DRAFT_140696 [Aaosphaeria arxii CBS 175.79]KAF2016920.1 hypothetical protein BU24DRAFT_140696 [Aaosphaeria arxii CBS 175.79]